MLDYFFGIDTEDRSLNVTVSAYADFLRSQALALGDPGMRDAFDAAICAGQRKGYAGFSELMAIESRLAQPVEHGPADDLNLRRSYWVIRDRFARVASAQARQGYADWAPKELLPPTAPPSTVLAMAVDDEKSAAAAAGRAHVLVEAAKAALTKAPGDPQLAISLARAQRDEAEARAGHAAAQIRRDDAGLVTARVAETDALTALGRAVAAETRAEALAATPATPDQAKAIDAARRLVASTKTAAAAASAAVARLVAVPGAK